MDWNDPYDSEDSDDLTEGLDPEGPSADDLDRFGDELITCPSCGSEMYDQAEMCHVCGEAIERGGRTVPGWAVIAAGLAILAILFLV